MWRAGKLFFPFINDERFSWNGCRLIATMAHEIASTSFLFRFLLRRFGCFGRGPIGTYAFGNTHNRSLGLLLREGEAGAHRAQRRCRPGAYGLDVWVS
jgi:hypothetical protein